VDEGSDGDSSTLLFFILSKGNEKDWNNKQIAYVFSYFAFLSAFAVSLI